MTQYMMGRKTVTYVREAQKGDRGYNEAKPRMVVVQPQGENMVTVPFDSLVAIEPAQVATDALDHDGDGRKGGSKKKAA